jgi:hypothetical protein
LNTQFGPFVSLANNVQYDSDSRVLGWQVRFRWILTPGNDIYVRQPEQLAGRQRPLSAVRSQQPRPNSW